MWDISPIDNLRNSTLHMLYCYFIPFVFCPPFCNLNWVVSRFEHFRQNDEIISFRISKSSQLHSNWKVKKVSRNFFFTRKSGWLLLRWMWDGKSSRLTLRTLEMKWCKARKKKSRVGDEAATESRRRRKEKSKAVSENERRQRGRLIIWECHKNMLFH